MALRERYPTAMRRMYCNGFEEPNVVVSRHLEGGQFMSDFASTLRCSITSAFWLSRSD